MKALKRVALTLSLTVLGAASLEAAASTPTGEPPNGVRIVNNYPEMVRVFVEDSEGREHKLGLVARGELVEFEIPEEIRSSHFRIRVYPSQQAWSPTFVDYAVKTNPLQLRDGEDVTVWLEANLATSVVELARR